MSKVRPAKAFWENAKWVQLPNSGNTLKLLIPNYNWKVISGWANSLCKVISQIMTGRKIGNRGSKLDFIKKSVKEQRVDGSCRIKFMPLRFSLTGFERNCPKAVFYPDKLLGAVLLASCRRCASYQNNLIKIPSKQLIKNFCILQSSFKLNPWFVTGFTDAECYCSDW